MTHSYQTKAYINNNCRNFTSFSDYRTWDSVIVTHINIISLQLLFQYNTIQNACPQAASYKSLYYRLTWKSQSYYPHLSVFALQII